MPVLERLNSSKEARRGLAHKDVSQLPSDIVESGMKAMEDLVDHVRRLFESSDAKEEDKSIWRNKWMHHHLKQLNLMEEKFQAKMKAYIEESYNDDIDKYLDAVLNQVLKKNPILVVLAAEYQSLSAEDKEDFFPSFTASETHKDEIRDSIIYSCFLDAIGWLVATEEARPLTKKDIKWGYARYPQPGRVQEIKNGESEEMMGEYLLRVFAELDKTVNWKDNVDLFFKMKKESVRKPFEQQTNRKAGFAKPDKLNGIILSTNILEAMYEDVLHHNDDNAEAGFEIMVQTCNKPVVECIEQGPDVLWSPDGKYLSIYQANMAFPDEWFNLYNSWNGAFCSQFHEVPFFLAKLFHPKVGGYYHQVKGMYLPFRMVTLYVVLMHSILNVPKLDVRFTKIDWYSERLKLMWGKLNRVAARAYQEKVSDAISEHEKKYKELIYEAERAAQMSFWIAFRSQIKLVRTANDGAALAKDKLTSFIRDISSRHDSRNSERPKADESSSSSSVHDRRTTSRFSLHHFFSSHDDVDDKASQE